MMIRMMMMMVMMMRRRMLRMMGMMMIMILMMISDGTSQGDGEAADGPRGEENQPRFSLSPSLLILLEENGL
jgi:hypothetical protein